MRWPLRVTCAVVGILGAAFACGPIEATSPLRAPVNACPLHDCAAYVQDGGVPSCNAGVCTVSAATKDLVLVLALPTDAFIAPGRQYLISLSSAPNQPSAPASCDSDGGAPKDDGGPCDLPLCSPPCCPLPGYAQDTTNYVVDVNAAQNFVHWYLGNPGETTLPIEATYLRMWGTTQQDARSLGLPVEPVPGQLQNSQEALSGPYETQPLEVQAYFPPGCYERTLQPYAPFATAFPPDIQTLTLSTVSSRTVDNFVEEFDTTTYQNPMVGPNGQFPTFQITRANGLNGWTAYLRDQTTGRVFSNVAALSGSFADVTLVTHHPSSPMTDALANVELVVAPPPGTPMPSYVTARVAQEFPVSQLYPTLPTPVTMTGRIVTLQGLPVEADLVFTATDITNLEGGPYPASSFEFVSRAHASVDSKTGTSTYSVLLPRGDYEVAVLPRDASSGLTVVSRHVDGEGDLLNGEDIVVGGLRAVRGRALVADGRPLADALVDAVPSACSADSPSAAVFDPSAPCAPRPAEATTADDGSFTLPLDPGGYLVRVRPAEGSRLPWVTRPIVVGSGSMDLPPMVVPAPVRVSMTFTGARFPDGTPICSGSNCVGNALVRVFTKPSPASPGSPASLAIELGQAITDTTGHFDMYLAPVADQAGPGF